MAEVRGATLVARSLKQQGVEYVFGLVGFPVVPIAIAAQREGLTFIGMRNEQAASYAAQAASYITGRPQVCLTVSGPGVVHGLAGLANAKINCWPMLLIGGASAQYQDGMGAFQEEDQLAAAKPFCKYARRIESPRRIPFYIEQALRTSWYGRPGPVYLDMPDDVILEKVEEDDVRAAPTLPDEPPRSFAPIDRVDAALDALESAERPLVVVGKGMAWARAEDEVRAFVERTNVPFLASPMGKGVVDDNHPLSIGAARTVGLRDADVIFLMGARLNWIMHFGRAPRFAKDVRIVQLDVAAEEMGHNVATEVSLLGDGKAVVGQLNQQLESRQWFYPDDTEWKQALAAKAEENQQSIQGMIDDDASPMNYYRALKDIREWMPKDTILVSEGANTMDIGRTQLPNKQARSRLDAASHGTIGVGLGFAIAAAVAAPDRPVIAVEGDSSFGFSGMEVETACRYKLPIKVVVLNNGGIGQGTAELPEDGPIAPTSLIPGARYDKVMEAFGGKGFYIRDPKELRAALDEAMAFDGPALVNVHIDARAGRKPQEYQWHT